MVGCWSPNNIIIEQHPIQWLKNKFPNRNIDKDGNPLKEYVNDYAVRIGFWEEVQEEDVK